MEFFATASNIATHIEDSKKGEKAILLLHGYMETMYIWEEIYKDLSRDYRVIRMDLPGHGLTCTAPVNTMDLMATVAKGVLDVCGVQKAAVIGHSMGGFAAIKCCELFPDRFERLILLNSYPYAETDESRAIRAREQAVLNADHLTTLAELSIPKMFHPDNLRRLDEKIRETIEICEMHDPSGIVASVKGIIQKEDYSPWLKECGIPVMSVCGDSDTLVTEGIRARMAVDFPNVKQIVLPKCGHNVFLEYPEKTLELIREFV